MKFLPKKLRVPTVVIWKNMDKVNKTFHVLIFKSTHKENFL